MAQLTLQEYASFIDLYKDFNPEIDEQYDITDIVEELLDYLLQEQDVPKGLSFPNTYKGKRKLLRALLNMRPPKTLEKDFFDKMNILLQKERNEKEITEVEHLEPITKLFPNNPFSQSSKFIVWQGDITELKVDAIVNAANKKMLGCLQPLHACIDNAIHSAAGPQLREDCSIIMEKQGEMEQTGNAKITRAYHLPSRFVLHTVGPIVPKGTEVTQIQKDQLASCYRSCLALANEITTIQTIAFCAISTGVFGFPKKEAAHIAVHTVNDWLTTHDHHLDKVIFNVFSEEDYKVYLDVLSDGK